ncbi:MAG: cytidine deaminase [Chitinophagaceae bacterium]|nr:cytidine deaminase [Chitinophagaceae bacterium]
MKEEVYQFSYKIFDSFQELDDDDRALLKTAQDAVSTSYAPYSEFNVGAAAKLANGEIVKGSNQENVSFPAGICAEGVVLAVAASLFPKVPIKTLAISYTTSKSLSDHPIAPCGICRQSLQEFREKTGSPVRLLMGGLHGKVIVVDDASLLLPFSFKF